MYYLQSRYYDPEVGRFVNADDAAYLGANGGLTSYNLFAYCENNPACLVDPFGTSGVDTAISEGYPLLLTALGVLDSATPFLEIAFVVAVLLLAIDGSPKEGKKMP